MIRQPMKNWIAKANAWPEQVASRKVIKKILPAVTLAESHKISKDGVTHEGPLIADDNGVGVQAVTSVRKDGLGLEFVGIQRFYFVYWSKVVSYRIESAPGQQSDGSTADAHDVVLTLTDDERVWAVTVHQTSVDGVTNLLTKWLAKKQHG